MSRRLGNELDQIVPTIIAMDLGKIQVEFDQEDDGGLRVTGVLQCVAVRCSLLRRVAM